MINVQTASTDDRSLLFLLCYRLFMELWVFMYNINTFMTSIYYSADIRKNFILNDIRMASHRRRLCNHFFSVYDRVGCMTMDSGFR